MLVVFKQKMILLFNRILLNLQPNSHVLHIFLILSSPQEHYDKLVLDPRRIRHESTVGETRPLYRVDTIKIIFF